MQGPLLLLGGWLLLFPSACWMVTAMSWWAPGAHILANCTLKEILEGKIWYVVGLPNLSTSILSLPNVFPSWYPAYEAQRQITSNWTPPSHCSANELEPANFFRSYITRSTCGHPTSISIAQSRLTAEGANAVTPPSSAPPMIRNALTPGGLRWGAGFTGVAMPAAPAPDGL